MGESLEDSFLKFKKFLEFQKGTPNNPSFEEFNTLADKHVVVEEVDETFQQKAKRTKKSVDDAHMAMQKLNDLATHYKTILLEMHTANLSRIQSLVETQKKLEACHTEVLERIDELSARQLVRFLFAFSTSSIIYPWLSQYF